MKVQILNSFLKKGLATFLIIFLVSGLSGCGNLSESTVKTVFEDYTLDIGEDVSITNVDILRRSTQDDTNVSFCKVQATGTIAKYVAFYNVEYKHYDKGGWILESISPADMENWTASYLDTGLKSQEDAATDIDFSGLPVGKSDFDTLIITEEEPHIVSTSSNGEQLAHIFTGTAEFSNEICSVHATSRVFYFFKNEWDNGLFCAQWNLANYGGITDSDVTVDLSGKWVGDTLKQNTTSTLNKYINRSQYKKTMTLSLVNDANGYPYGTLESIVPYIDAYIYTANKNFAGLSIDLGSPELNYAKGIRDLWDQSWSEDFQLCGAINSHNESNFYNTGGESIQMYNLAVNIKAKTLSGIYNQAWGDLSKFDFVLTWVGR